LYTYENFPVLYYWLSLCIATRVHETVYVLDLVIP